MYILNIEYIPYNACTYSLSSTYCTSPVIQNSWTGIFVTNWYLYVLTIEYISYNVCAYSLSSTYCTNPVVQISFVYINMYIYRCMHIYIYIYIYIYIHTLINTQSEVAWAESCTFIYIRSGVDTLTRASHTHSSVFFSSKFFNIFPQISNTVTQFELFQ